MSLVTGKDCTLTIGSQIYDAVVQRFALEFDASRVEYPTLDGPKAGPGSETGTLSITAAYDSAATNSLFDDLWAAVDAGTAVAYSAVVGSTTFAGNAVAVRPSIVGEAGAVSEFTVDLPLDGIPTPTPTIP